MNISELVSLFPFIKPFVQGLNVTRVFRHGELPAYNHWCIPFWDRTGNKTTARRYILFDCNGDIVTEVLSGCRYHDKEDVCTLYASGITIADAIILSGAKEQVPSYLLDIYEIEGEGRTSKVSISTLSQDVGDWLIMAESDPSHQRPRREEEDRIVKSAQEKMQRAVSSHQAVLTQLPPCFRERFKHLYGAALATENDLASEART